jgi:hypothetical protein
MKKSFNHTLVLLGVLVGLLAWYVFYEKKFKPAQDEKESQAKVLIPTPFASVQELQVSQKDGDKYRELRFKKAGTDWNIISPVEDLAEPGAVSGMVTTLTSTKYERIVEEKPTDLEAFGLKQPKLKLSARVDSNTAPEEVWVGNDTPDGIGVYAKVATKDTVYKVPSVLRTTFDKPIADYRNKKVLGISRADVSELEIRNTSESFTLKKDPSDNWLLTRDGIPAASLEVNKTLNAAIDLQATGFASDKPGKDLSQWGLSTGGVSVLFKKKDGQSLLLLGKVKDKFYAKRSDKEVVYEISKDLFEKVGRPSKEYRDLKLAMFNRFEVKKIRVEHPPESFELVKENADWKIANDAAAKVDTAKVDDFLTRLQDARVSAFLSPNDKVKQPSLTVTLTERKGGNESETVTLSVAKPVSGKSIATRKGFDKGLSITEADFKKINAFKQEFLAAEPAKDAKAEDKANKPKE